MAIFFVNSLSDKVIRTPLHVALEFRYQLYAVDEQVLEEYIFPLLHQKTCKNNLPYKKSGVSLNEVKNFVFCKH